MAHAPMPTIALRDVQRMGHGLERPECVLAGASGTVWVSDRRASVCRIDPDGQQTLLGPSGGLTNGVAIDRDGSIVVTDIERGEVYRIDADGQRIGELAAGLGAPNFVCFAPDGTLWLTVSTSTTPRQEALANRVHNGYAGRLAHSAVDVAASQLGYANEMRFDVDRGRVYVVESGRGRITKFDVTDDGSWSAGGPFGPDPLFPGAFPDGIALDVHGNLWATDLSRNSILLLTPDGELHVVVEDPDGTVIDAPSSIAFAGPDLTTAYIGSLRLDHLLVFDAPWAGAPLPHWNHV